MGNSVSASKDAMEGGIKKIGACMSRDTGEGDDNMVGMEPVGFGLHGPETFVDGLRVHGDGMALCSESLSQDRVHFQVKIVCNGDWAVGVAKEAAHSEAKVGGGESSWGIDAATMKGEVEITDGDVIGVSFDQARSWTS